MLRCVFVHSRYVQTAWQVRIPTLGIRARCQDELIWHKDNEISHGTNTANLDV